MPQNNVVRLDSTRQGAPALTGQVGTLNAVLYQGLCTGFNSQTLTSLTRSGTTATATKNGHGFLVGDWVTHSGASPSGWNGSFRITSADTNTYSFTVDSGLTTPATGTITTVFSPAGWTRAYNSGNVAVYKGDDQSGQLPVWVSDNGVNAGSNQSYRCALFKGYESWSGSSGTAAWPTTAQQSVGLIIQKSTTLDSTARPWWIYADGKRFYIGIKWHPDYDFYDVFAFGDRNHEIAGDAYPGFIIGATSDYMSYTGAYNYFSLTGTIADTQSGKYLPRKYDQTGTARQFGMVGNYAVSQYSGYGGLSGLNRGTEWEWAPILVVADTAIYGTLPGIYQSLISQYGDDGEVIPPRADLPGRDLVVRKVAASNLGLDGRIIIDTTGPWE